MKHSNGSKTWATVATVVSVVFITASAILSTMLHSAYKKNKELQKLHDDINPQKDKGHTNESVTLNAKQVNTRQTDKKYTVTSQQLHTHIVNALRSCENEINQQARHLQQTIINVLRQDTKHASLLQERSSAKEQQDAKNEDDKDKKTNNNSAHSSNDKTLITQKDIDTEQKKIEQKIITLIYDVIGEAVSLSADKIHTAITSQ